MKLVMTGEQEVSVDVFSHLSEDMVDIWVHKTPSMSVQQPAKTSGATG